MEKGGRKICKGEKEEGIEEGEGGQERRERRRRSFSNFKH
jgi:hypothetical protein